MCSMIKSISLSDIASYHGDVQDLTDLSAINFIFGSNGSGKTTISNVIEDPSRYYNCHVKWKNDVPLDTLVYSQKFVERNFNQSGGIKGIFTLGEDNIEIKNAIEEQNRVLSEFKNKKSALNKVLDGEDGSSGKKEELNELEQKFEDKCWDQKIKYDNIFKQAFTGYRNNKTNFKRKILEESSSNIADAKPLDFLEKKAETIFNENLVPEVVIDLIKTECFIQHEENQILQKFIVGKGDIDIARIIGELNNIDWVKKGCSYLKQIDGICPFCQQRISDSFTQSLNKYFDETYADDISHIEELLKHYREDSTKLLEEIDKTIVSSSNHLDLELFNPKKELLRSFIDGNISQIEDKLIFPNQIFELKSIGDIVSDINNNIDSANQQINEHNQICANIEAEIDKLTSQIWKYLLETGLKDALDDYHRNKNELMGKIQTIDAKIKSTTKEIIETDRNIRNLETQITSLIPTKNEINGLLLSFGFQNFSLDIADGTNYKLVRQDGTDATETLS